MKKKLIVMLLATFTGFLFAQKAITIESALDSAVTEIKKSVPTGVEIAVSRFSSDSKEMSEWLVQEVESRLVKTSKYTLLERSAKNLKIIYHLMLFSNVKLLVMQQKVSYYQDQQIIFRLK